MMRSSINIWSWIAGIIALALMAEVALGQARVEQNGHATDANPQVGGNGYNYGSPNGAKASNQFFITHTNGGQSHYQIVNVNAGTANPAYITNNVPGTTLGQILSGNMSFSPTGNTYNYTSSGNTSSILSQANSSIPVLGGAGLTGLPTAGWVNIPAQTGLLIPPVAPQSQGPVDMRLNVDTGASQVNWARPGELALPGPVDVGAGGGTIYTASPLYGVQAWQAGANNNGVPTITTPNGPQEKMIADLDQAMQYRKELNAASGGTDINNPSGNNNGGAKALTPLQVDKSPLKPISTTAQPLKPNLLSPNSGDFSTDQRNRQYLDNSSLPGPAQQSTLYAEMQKRLDQYKNAKSDVDASRQFKALLQARRALQNGQGLANAPVPLPAPGSGVANPTPVPAPLQVESLGEGMKGKSLQDLLDRGQDLTARQQYDKSIETYDQAWHVAPNNPLILIGRAEAELGGAYYRQAEADLRLAFQEDQAVLMAQYDVTKTLGSDRVQTLVTDLQQMADNSPGNATPAFLLAFVTYNTHQETQTAAWLDSADKRSAYTDDVIPLLRKYWTLKATTQPDANK